MNDEGRLNRSFRFPNTSIGERRDTSWVINLNVVH